jgi:hypothetical protein
VPLESEKNASGNAKGAENSPAIQKANLAGRKESFAGVANLTVMKKVPVHCTYLIGNRVVALLRKIRAILWEHRV